MTAKASRIQLIFLQKLLAANDDCCYLCREKLDLSEATKDHVFPKSAGYSIAYNMMPAHQRCNLDKGDRYPTWEEIELSCIVYENIGYVFSPRGIKESKLFTKPIEYFVNNLEKIAA
jgi:hypothetical protein